VSPISATGFWLPLDIDEPDMSKPESANKYGTWILWRYLSERLGQEVVRDAWNLARGAPFGIQALEAMLATRGQAWADVLHQFAIANYSVGSSYAEGALYMTVPGVGPQPQALPVPFSGSIPMGHLSNDYYLFTPPGPPTTQLTLTVTLSGPETNPRASAIVLRATGNDPPVPLVSGVPTPLPFDSSVGVTGIVLVLSNGSTRFVGCDTDQLPPFFSCFGAPVDDTVSFAVSATPSGP
jgi:hypothetical protein